MNIDEKAFRADIAISTWPETTLISRKTMTPRHPRRRRAEARAKWPMYLPDVAYRIERLPPPRRQHGRTWEQLARDRFLASFPPGIPPWACEALKPEFRPRTMSLAELLSPTRRTNLPSTTTDSPVDTLLAAATLLGTAATLHHAADLVIQSNNTRRIRQMNHLMELIGRDLNKLTDGAPSEKRVGLPASAHQRRLAPRETGLIARICLVSNLLDPVLNVSIWNAVPPRNLKIGPSDCLPERAVNRSNPLESCTVRILQSTIRECQKFQISEPNRHLRKYVRVARERHESA